MEHQTGNEQHLDHKPTTPSGRTSCQGSGKRSFGFEARGKGGVGGDGGGKGGNLRGKTRGSARERERGRGRYKGER